MNSENSIFFAEGFVRLQSKNYSIEEIMEKCSPLDLGLFYKPKGGERYSVTGFQGDKFEKTVSILTSHDASSLSFDNMSIHAFDGQQIVRTMRYGTCVRNLFFEADIVQRIF